MKVCKWQMTKETIDTGKQSELIIFNSLRESSFFGAGISCAFSSCSCPRWRLEDGWGSLCDLRSQIPPASHRPLLSSSQNFQTLQWFLLDRSLWHEEPQPVLLVLKKSCYIYFNSALSGAVCLPRLNYAAQRFLARLVCYMTHGCCFPSSQNSDFYNLLTSPLIPLANFCDLLRGPRMYWILYGKRKSLDVTDNSLPKLGQLGHSFASLTFHLSLPPSMHNILEVMDDLSTFSLLWLFVVNVYVLDSRTEVMPALCP